MRTVLGIVARAHVDRAALFLAAADHQHKIVVGRAGVANLLVQQGRIRHVAVHHKPLHVQSALHFLGIAIELFFFAGEDGVVWWRDEERGD